MSLLLLAVLQMHYCVYYLHVSFDIHLSAADDAVLATIYTT